VGTLVWHKGVHVLLDAVSQLPAGDYELLVFGDPDVFPDYVASLRESARGMPVRFLGRFDSDRAPDVYAQLDAVVVPSLWLENSPLVIHEAFMARLPVVGARIGGIADLVTDGHNGLLYDPASARDLADALRRLVSTPGLARALGQRHPEVKSIAQDAAEWEARYTDVLDGRGHIASGQPAHLHRPAHP
jgi:glycosyltransferase involved in cell wall biosynthesis